MSVDKTIEELSGTLAQLGVLVEHINTQIVGITSRINLTLDNFDHSVTGIASDAGFMTNQVGTTISQVPNAWVFYLLFITLIVVLILLSVLIIINLATRIHAIYRILTGDTNRSDSPVASVVYSESKQPLNLSQYPASPMAKERSRHIAVPIETEPRRFGHHESVTSYSHLQDPGGGLNQQAAYYPPSRSAAPKIYSTPEGTWTAEEADGLPPPLSTRPPQITPVLESNGTDAYLRRPLTSAKDPNRTADPRVPPRFQTGSSVSYNPRHSMRAAEPV
ncbi:hypothetical protein M3Y99_01518100 [Aphelenchoides fujianensis]|nr:hypothetical protein M3Y99_01518100 [Aphelenchoides fujianensis]